MGREKAKNKRRRRKPIALRYGREINYKTGEGMNLDTLFLSCRVDDDTYVRYLREFEEQQRHGVGNRAFARIVDGKTYYEMSDKKDYFYKGMLFEDTSIYHPFDDVCEIAAEHLPMPDYRSLAVREIEKCNGSVLYPNYGEVSVEGERWMPSGSMTMPPPDSPFDESLDDYLKRVEEHPQSAL